MKLSSLCLLIFFLFVVLLLLITGISGEISDDECGKFIKEQPSEPAEVIDNFYRKQIVQKSLLMVFDGTLSMRDDLAQMVPAAKEIIKSFTSRKENPIKNFVLTVFQDPSKTYASCIISLVVSLLSVIAR